MTVGIMNPTLVFSMWMFKLSMFNKHNFEPEDNDLDRYAWIYLLASTIFSAPLAGLVARFTMKTQLENEYLRLGVQYYPSTSIRNNDIDKRSFMTRRDTSM